MPAIFVIVVIKVSIFTALKSHFNQTCINPTVETVRRKFVWYNIRNISHDLGPSHIIWTGWSALSVTGASVHIILLS